MINIRMHIVVSPGECCVLFDVFYDESRCNPSWKHCCHALEDYLEAGPLQSLFLPYYELSVPAALLIL